MEIENTKRQRQRKSRNEEFDRNEEQSPSQEIVNETQNNDQPRPTRKRRNQNNLNRPDHQSISDEIDPNSQITNHETNNGINAETINETGEERPRNRRRKRQPVELSIENVQPDSVQNSRIFPSNGNIGVAINLEDLNDDIENIPTKLESTTNRNFTDGFDNYAFEPAVFNRETIQSGESIQRTADQDEKIFVKKNGRFKSETKEAFEKRLDEARKLQLASQTNPLTHLERFANDTLHQTISIQRGFRSITNFLHGLLAGFSVFNTLIVYTATQTANTTTVLPVYLTLLRPISIIYFTLLLLIAIACLDKLDINRPIKHWKIHHIGSIISLILILIALIVGHCQYRNEFRIFVWVKTKNISTLTPIINVSTEWKIFEMVRSVTLCLAWLAVSMMSNYDRLSENLGAELDDEDDNEYFQTESHYQT